MQNLSKKRVKPRGWAPHPIPVSTPRLSHTVSEMLDSYKTTSKPPLSHASPVSAIRLSCPVLEMPYSATTAPCRSDCVLFPSGEVYPRSKLLFVLIIATRNNIPFNAIFEYNEKPCLTAGLFSFNNQRLFCAFHNRTRPRFRSAANAGTQLRS